MSARHAKPLEAADPTREPSLLELAAYIELQVQRIEWHVSMGAAAAQGTSQSQFGHALEKWNASVERVRECVSEWQS